MDYNDACGMVCIACDVPCSIEGADLAGVDVNILYNPDKDITIPYIAEIDATATDAANSRLDLWEGDEALNFQAQGFVVTFSEAMRTTHNIKAAIDFSSDFIITVTSAGTNPTDVASQDIIKDYTVSMSSAGVMLIKPEYKDVADYTGLRAAINVIVTPDWGPDVALAITAYDGSYDIEFEDGSWFLTDASLVPWSDDNDYPSYMRAYKESTNIEIQWFILGGPDEDEFEIDAAF